MLRPVITLLGKAWPLSLPDHLFVSRKWGRGVSEAGHLGLGPALPSTPSGLHVPPVKQGGLLK